MATVLKLPGKRRAVPGIRRVSLERRGCFFVYDKDVWTLVAQSHTGEIVGRKRLPGIPVTAEPDKEEHRELIVSMWDLLDTVDPLCPRLVA